MKNLLGLCIVFLAMACNTETKKVGGEKAVAAAGSKAPSNLSFKNDSVQNLYHAYIELKDALVASKFDEAKAKSKNLATALQVHTGCENTSLIATKIEKAPTIAEQRTQFTNLSSDVIALFKHADLTSGTIFVQHCPMANKGEGGDWLSSEKKIQNPYYGSEMMECGAVIEEIKNK